MENLLQIVAIKRLCKDAGVDKVEAGPKGAVVSFHQDRFANLEGLVGFVQRQAGSVKLRPDHKLIYQRRWDDSQARLAGVRTTVARVRGGSTLPGSPRPVLRPRSPQPSRTSTRRFLRPLAMARASLTRYEGVQTFAGKLPRSRDSCSSLSDPSTAGRATASAPTTPFL